MKNKDLEEELTKQVDNKEAKYIRTGCDLLNILLGGKKDVFGIQAGTILGIWGDSGAGKSFVINEMISANYYRDKKNFRWVSSDSENGNKFDCEKLYGLDISSEGKVIEGFKLDGKGNPKPASIVFHPSTSVQEMDAHLSLFLSGLKENEYGIYAQDSLDSIPDASAEEVKQERIDKLIAGTEVIDKGSYNLGKQKFLSNFFNNHVASLAEKNCLLVITSQYRAKIGGFIPNQKSVNCGTALKYYCHTILDLTMVRKIEASGRWIGSVVKARTKNKSRTERPGREIFYVVYFTRGIDNVGSNIDYLFDLRDDKGKLKTDEVCWGGEIPTLKSVTAWLNETEQMGDYKEFAYKIINRRAVNLDIVHQWANIGIIDKDGVETLKPACSEAYNSKFGRKMTRDELRNLCSQDSKIRKQLRQLVIDKWEEEEQKASDAVGFQKIFDNFD